MNNPNYNNDQIEEYTQYLLKTYIPNRIPLSPIDPEEIAMKTFSNHFQLESVPLKDNHLGICQIDTKGKIIISVNSSIYENPNTIGKSNFTIAHEFGHGVLHNDLLKKYSSENFNLIDTNGKFRGMIEKQADYFAGALLMPKNEMFELNSRITKMVGGKDKFKDSLSMYQALGSKATKAIIESWAKKYNVSSFAFSIRLQKLGIIDIFGSSFIRWRNGEIYYGF